MLGVQLLSFASQVWHLCQGNDDKHHHHHQPDGYVGIADDCKVVQADVSLLGLGERTEDNLSGSIALVGKQLWQHDERCYSHS